MGYGLGYRASRWTRRASHRIQSFHHSGVNRTRLSVVANTRASASRVAAHRVHVDERAFDRTKSARDSM